MQHTWPLQRCRHCRPPQQGEDDEQQRLRQQDAEVFLSEVHMECLRPAAGQGTATNFITADGGELARIQHAMATPLSRVGLQVWHGALLLADYMLHEAAASTLAGCVALELGAGPGLAGLVMARLARCVYLTGEPAPSRLPACRAASAARPQLLGRRSTAHVLCMLCCANPLRSQMSGLTC